jgi:uncharacterized membrane protein
MSTPTFLAWSLLVAGAFALLYAWTERYRRQAAARLTGAFKRTILALALIYYGAVIVRGVAPLFFTESPPAWTRLVSSAFPLVLGLFFALTLTAEQKEGGMRLFAGFLIVIGAVTLTVDGYRYAISVGTAGSWGLR